MDIWVQVSSTAFLLIGVIFAEFLVRKAYGSLKKWYYYVFEISIFTVFFSLLISSIYISKYDFLSILLIHLTLGFIGIVFSYSIVSLFGKYTITPEQKEIIEESEKEHLVPLIYLLKKENLDSEKIKTILKKSNFSRKEVDFSVDDIFKKEEVQHSKKK